MTTRDEIMRKYFESLSDEEKRIFQRLQHRARTEELDRSPARIAFGTSTPHYTAVLEFPLVKRTGRS